MKIRDRILGLRRVPAKDLLPHPRNWRTHPKAQRDALQGILAEVGYADALIARETPEGLQLIDGHLRAETTPDQEVPVLVLDVTEEEADKLLVSLDPLAGLAGMDEAKLGDLLKGIATDSEGLKALFHGLQPESRRDGNTDPDDVPEPPDTPVTLPGDLWLLGDHRLLCGDSSKAEDVDRLLDGAAIHLANCDPPYNVKVESRSNNSIAAGLSSFTAMHHQGLDVARHPGKSKPTHRKMRAKDRPLVNDFLGEEEFDRMVGAWFGNLARILVPGRSFYIWGGYSNLLNFPRALVDAGLHFSQTVIWVKRHAVLTRKDFLGDHEWAYYGWKKGAAHYFNPAITNATDVWEVKKVSPQSMVHLTEKPVELAARALEYSSRPGENVCDLFGGSGSTLIAAQQTGRRAYLMEIDCAYADVIVTRFQEFSGKEAVHGETGETFAVVKEKRVGAATP